MLPVTGNLTGNLTKISSPSEPRLINYWENKGYLWNSLFSAYLQSGYTIVVASTLKVCRIAADF